MIVNVVGEDSVTVLVNEPGSSYNRTLSVNQLVADQTTLAALVNAFSPSEVNILEYNSEIGLYEGIAGHWPALSERLEYKDARGSIVTSTRVVDLSNFILLEGTTTIEDSDVGFVLYETRTMISFSGVAALRPTVVTTRSFDLPNGPATFQLFGEGSLDGFLENQMFHLSVRAAGASLVASIGRFCPLLSLFGQDIELDNLLWKLNDTHQLMLFQLTPGEHQISFELAPEAPIIPMDATLALVGTYQRGRRVH